MLKKLVDWYRARLDRKNRETARAIVIGQRAAHVMVQYLYGAAPIVKIDVNEPEEIVGLRDPGNLDLSVMMNFIMKSGCGLLLARESEAAMLEADDTLLHGRRLLTQRLPDRSLMGVCDGNGAILTPDAFIAYVKSQMERIMGDQEKPMPSFDDLTKQRIFFIGILAKRAVAHFYLAIVYLAKSLLEQPVVVGEAECRELLERCLKQGLKNPLPISCPCHSATEAAIGKYMLQRASNA